MNSVPRRNVIVAALALAGCATAPAADTSMEGLDAFDVSWRAAYAAGDRVALLDLYEPDAWLMTRDQPARKGREEIVNYLTESAGHDSGAQMVFRYEDRRIEGDHAYMVARWWLTKARPNAEPYRDSGRSLVVLKRGRDGKWRMWRDIDNRTPDAVFPVPPA